MTRGRLMITIVRSVGRARVARDIRHRLPITDIRTPMLIRTLTDTIRLRFILDLAMADLAATAEAVSGARTGFAAGGALHDGPLRELLGAIGS